MAKGKKVPQQQQRQKTKALPTQREMLFGMSRPPKARATPPKETPEKKWRPGYPGMVDERAVVRTLQASYAGAMGMAPPEVIREIVKEAKRKKTPKQVQQLIARFVPGSDSTILDVPTSGHWIVPKTIRREQIRGVCTPEQLEWARACVRASRKQKKIKRSGGRWRAVRQDYLASL